ncbi:hypothetical protein [Aquabacterium sp.]|uniref:hypothetical protein n=1 Tax=Aquabacterium sp. TaxID=1872578 RepID=UPI00403779E7
MHATGHHVGPAEVRAWTSSLMHMAKVLHDDEIPDDAGVAIEYQVPQTAKRIDFLITGLDANHQPKVVIVELKQWSEARVSEKDGIIWARRGGRAGETEGAHPSYLAWSYAALLADFNATVQDEALALQPCAYRAALSSGSIDLQGQLLSPSSRGRKSERKGRTQWDADLVNPPWTTWWTSHLA